MLGVLDLLQLVQAARGAHPDPPSLLVTHGLTGGLAGLAALSLWRGHAWARIAVVAWGFSTSLMLVALGPVLDTPPAERPQLWMAAGLVAIFTVGVSWHLHRRMGKEGKAVDPT